MSTHDVQPSVSRNPDRKVQDLPGCIKYILLLFVILLLLAEIFSGEFRRFPDLSPVIWLVLLIKLLLIALLLWLIKVQRTLNCKITAPGTGCITEEIDPVKGILFIRVKGTASGTVFGHYTLTMSGPYPYTVTYPAGGGTVPVNNGELGIIDTTAVDHGDFTITLTVFPIGAGAPVSCSVTFTLLKVNVYITSAAYVPALPNAFDPDAELVDTMHKVAIGGGIHLEGAAYVFTCADRKLERYEIRYARVTAPGPGPSQPAFDVPTPADWPPVTSQLNPPLVYDATKYYSWTEVGPAPMNLINYWTTQHFGAPSPGGTDYPCLGHTSWNSYAITDPDPEHRGGRYSLLLIVTDTLGHLYYDMQRIWLDNWPIQCKILKLQKPGLTPGTWIDLPPCTDILMSWKKLRIVGIAWDALIDKDWGTPGPPPNDNFKQYHLWYAKEFVAGTVDILISTNRVPSPLTFPGPTFMPTDASADELAVWDLTTLDAGPLPIADPGPPPKPHTCESAPSAGHKLYRGCACTYTVTMNADDKTIEESNSGYHHSQTPPVPIKIINDL